MVGWLATGLGLLREGASSNWWGLQCPLHCHQPSLGSILAGFFLGVLVGALLALSAGIYIYLHWPSAGEPPAFSGPEPTPNPSVRRRQDRLRGYLHA